MSAAFEEYFVGEKILFQIFDFQRDICSFKGN